MVGRRSGSDGGGRRTLSLFGRNRGQSAGDQLISVILVIVIAAAIGFIGTDVNDQINDSVSITDPPNDSLSSAQTNLSGGFASAMGLTDVVFIVLMFSVILAALLAFRGGRI